MTSSSKVELNMDENKMKDIDMIMHENWGSLHTWNLIKIVL